tara:strand:- start:674 stop:1402 length:729 start_codon:yes stop_codon:yes gene_type:complete
MNECHACGEKNTYQNMNIADTTRCTVCGHIFRKYNGDVVEYHREKYRNSGEEGSNMYPESERKHYIDNVKKAVLPYIDKNMTALEIGSGDGLFAKEIKNHLLNITCLDVDSKMTKMCSDLGFESLTGDVLELEETKKFDVVFGFDVLEHVLDIQSFKQKANKIVNKYLILQVPVNRNMVPPNDYNRGTADSFDGHSHYFNSKSITLLFEEYFDVVKIGAGRRGELARGMEMLCVFKKRNFKL